MLDLLKATPEELKEYGARLGLTFHHKTSAQTKIDQIRKAVIKAEEDARNEIRAEGQVAAKHGWRGAGELEEVQAGLVQPGLDCRSERGQR